MISRTFCLLLGLTFLLLLPVCAEETKPALQGVVSWVYDGDTLEVDTFGKIRLIGIDAPEREDSKRDQYLLDKGVSTAVQRQIHEAARQFIIKHAKGKMVALGLDETARDRYGRLLAYVYLPDGRLLNRILVEQGLAVVYRRFKFTMKESFLAAEDKARQSEVGLWAKSRAEH